MRGKDEETSAPTMEELKSKMSVREMKMQPLVHRDDTIKRDDNAKDNYM